MTAGALLAERPMSGDGCPARSPTADRGGTTGQVATSVVEFRRIRVGWLWRPVVFSGGQARRRSEVWRWAPTRRSAERHGVEVGRILAAIEDHLADPLRR